MKVSNNLCVTIGFTTISHNNIYLQKLIAMTFTTQSKHNYNEFYLKTAKRECESHNGNNNVLSWGASTAQGWRLYQEDAHVAINSLNNDNNTSLFAVMDGHNGPEVAYYASKNLPQFITRDKNYNTENVTKCMEDAFIAFDESLISKKPQEKLHQYRQQLMKKPITEREKPGFNTGCTCVMALIKDSTLYVANTGDSRCVLSNSKGKAVPMTIDHKPDDETETTRIRNAGGFVQNGCVNGKLNVSRAFGDHDFKNNKKLPLKDQMVSAFPDVKTYQLKPKQEEFMVLASDGIWDAIENQEVVSYIRRRMNWNTDLQKICEEIIRNCISLISPEEGGTATDNMSCIIVVFGAYPKKKDKTAPKAKKPRTTRHSANSNV